MQTNTPRTLTAITRSHSSTPMSRKERRLSTAKIAALGTITSTLPKVSTVLATSAATWASSETSTSIPNASPPDWVIVLTTLVQSSRSQIATLAPSSANRLA